MSRNWLIEAARRAGLTPAGNEPLELAGLSAADAWALVGTAFGVTPETLAKHVAAHFALELADFEAFQPRALRRVPEKFARRYEIFPLSETSQHLVVATCDPMNFDTEYSLAFASGLTPVFQVAPPAAIREAIKHGYSPQASIESLLRTAPAVDRDTVRMLEEIRPETQAAVETLDVDDAPVVRLANLIIHDAVTRRASDIHIGPGPGGGAVRFRIDGVLQDYLQMPIPALNRVVSRIKIIGNLDITDRHRPQDGRTRVQVNNQPFDLRISTVPTRDSENAVIRILDPKASTRFRDLALPVADLDRFRQLLAHRDGIVIVTGPTGSGKTTTLYAGIRELATGDVNIMTVEDPVEYELPGVTQIQVEAERDVTFASALRAILRQDPDVIFVGEIRDQETAQVAVQASTTGHLVLATLHTNSALGIIPRLAELGLDMTSIESSLRGALAQRLVRRVCTKCAKVVSDDPTTEEEHLSARYRCPPTVRAIGCEHCLMTGYRGRIPVAEVFTMDYRLQELVART
ncbi:MAG: GspE/PulE family protein, partial [Gemmatimonadota bacterium]